MGCSAATEKCPERSEVQKRLGLNRAGVRAPAPVRALKYALSREGWQNSSGHSILFWKLLHASWLFLWIWEAIRCCSTFDRLYAYIRGVMGKANSSRRLHTYWARRNGAERRRGSRDEFSTWRTVIKTQRSWKETQSSDPFYFRVSKKILPFISF